MDLLRFLAAVLLQVDAFKYGSANDYEDPGLQPEK